MLIIVLCSYLWEDYVSEGICELAFENEKCQGKKMRPDQARVQDTLKQSELNLIIIYTSIYTIFDGFASINKNVRC